MTTQEVHAVIQAFDEGKAIQFKYHSDNLIDWIDVLPRDRFDLNFYSYDYRVKPEPLKPREWDLRGHHIYEIDGAGSINALTYVGNKAIRVREVLEETSVVKP